MFPNLFLVILAVADPGCFWRGRGHGGGVSGRGLDGGDVPWRWFGDGFAR